MTDRDGKQIPMQVWMWEEGAKIAFRTFIMALIGLVSVVVFEPVREWGLGMWRLPNAVDSNIERIEGLEQSVRELSQPDQVFELSRFGTRPSDGFCVEREPCDIRVRLRRDINAIKCNLVPGSVRWGFVNPRSEVFTSATRLDPALGRNIGPAWEDITIVLQTPGGLSPNANFTFTAQYTDCPGWLEGEDALEYQSEPVSFAIRQSEE